MPPRSNNWDNFNFALAMGNDRGDDTLPTTQLGHDNYSTVLVQLGQAVSANYSYSELSYVSAKLNISSVDSRCIVQGAICRGPRRRDYALHAIITSS